MRLRSQLAIAFFLLAVLPLTGITIYSYQGSQRAIRQAVRAEATALASAMSTRVDVVADQLQARLSLMRHRSDPRAPQRAFEKARREAIAAAEQRELRLLLRAIVSGAERRLGTIPFAIDAEGRLYAPETADEATLMSLGIASGATRARRDARDWVVAERRDPRTGIVIGVARPVGDALGELRRTAARNLALGLGLALLAGLGILPLSRRMTRHLASLTEAAERLGRGERDVRVPVPHGREFARLATTFNRLAGELRATEERLLEQARLRKELEIGRRIQETLLPSAPLRTRLVEVSGVSLPAREVGGDFFDYIALPDERLALVVGDVSGKGVPAALLMASLQATLRARLALDDDLAGLVDALDHELDSDRPLAPYLTLFLAVLDSRSGRLRFVNAGHPTPFLVRGDGGVERLASTGRPPGLYPGGGYEQHECVLYHGDAMFLYTDGLTEAEDESGEPFGTSRLEALLRAHAGEPLEGLLGRVDAALRAHRGREEWADDATLVMLRFAAEGGRA